MERRWLWRIPGLAALCIVFASGWIVAAVEYNGREAAESRLRVRAPFTVGELNALASYCDGVLAATSRRADGLICVGRGNFPADKQ